MNTPELHATPTIRKRPPSERAAKRPRPGSLVMMQNAIQHEHRSRLVLSPSEGSMSGSPGIMSPMEMSPNLAPTWINGPTTPEAASAGSALPPSAAYQFLSPPGSAFGANAVHQIPDDCMGDQPVGWPAPALADQYHPTRQPSWTAPHLATSPPPSGFNRPGSAGAHEGGMSLLDSPLAPPLSSQNGMCGQDSPGISCRGFEPIQRVH